MIEAIYWHDAYVTDDERPELDRADALTVVYGHITKEDGLYAYVSHFYDGISEEWAAPYTVIPRSLIVKRIKLSEVI